MPAQQTVGTDTVGDRIVEPDEPLGRRDDMVEAASVGLDQGELVTIPSPPDAADWQSYEAAREKLMPNLPLKVPAARFRAGAAALDQIGDAQPTVVYQGAITTQLEMEATMTQVEKSALHRQDPHLGRPRRRVPQQRWPRGSFEQLYS